ncbi:hypothetical protein [Sphingobacterium anhuiense]|uniref:Uncharacterized protein n=1 Tax=Sphingobacterium anhuiense TaxID=493780 RepID=A0ABW5YXS6_9SPHI
MQKTCNWESYVLSPGKELSSFLNEKRVSVIKKPIMITDLPQKTLKSATVTRNKGHKPYVSKAILDKRAKELYYSLVVPSEKDTSPFINIVRDARNNVLRITMVNMAIYECYLFALNLPSNFPKEQIIVHGHDRTRYVPCRFCQYGGKHLYDYELTVSTDTGVEAYQKQILNDLNAHFQLDVRVEQLSIVKDSRTVMTEKGASMDLIWEEQPTMIIKARN